MKNILICIATFKRKEGLVTILNSIQNLFLDELTSCDVLVVDNCSLESCGFHYVNDIKSSYRFPLYSIVEKEKGISYARNAMLKEFHSNSRYDYIAMIDDDQEVEPNWLFELLVSIKLLSVDIVGSRVVPKFIGAPPSWVYDLDLFNRKSRKSGVVDIVHGTGGVIIKKEFFNKVGLEFFDETFALTGGGDKEFFFRLAQMGAKFGFCETSVCYEYYDATRLTIDWAKRRAERIGNAEIRLRVKNGDSLFRLLTVATIKALLLLI